MPRTRVGRSQQRAACEQPRPAYRRMRSSARSDPESRPASTISTDAPGAARARRAASRRRAESRTAGGRFAAGRPQWPPWPAPVLHGCRRSAPWPRPTRRGARCPSGSSGFRPFATSTQSSPYARPPRMRPPAPSSTARRPPTSACRRLRRSPRAPTSAIFRTLLPPNPNGHRIVALDEQVGPAANRPAKPREFVNGRRRRARDRGLGSARRRSSAAPNALMAGIVYSRDASEIGRSAAIGLSDRMPPSGAPARRRLDDDAVKEDS